MNNTFEKYFSKCTLKTESVALVGNQTEDNGWKARVSTTDRQSINSRKLKNRVEVMKMKNTKNCEVKGLSKRGQALVERARQEREENKGIREWSYLGFVREYIKLLNQVS